jgi:putative ABC transport system substrate-binding protein
MRLIGLAVILGLSFTLTPLTGDALQTTRRPLIGFLCNTTKLTQAFGEGLRELGYVDGRNILVEYRCVEGRKERGRELAAALLRLKPDLLVGSSDPLIKALVDATHTIPIVMTVSGDLVGNKFVASLAAPAGMSRACQYSRPSSLGSAWNSSRRLPRTLRS